MQARGKVREILLIMDKVDSLVGEAVGCIDTSQQYRIRALLQEAQQLMGDQRDKYDPL